MKFVELNGMNPKAPVMFAELNAVEFRGVYPRAEVTLAAEIENAAVNETRPFLSKVNTLLVALLSAKEIPVT